MVLLLHLFRQETIKCYAVLCITCTKLGVRPVPTIVESKSKFGNRKEGFRFLTKIRGHSSVKAPPLACTTFYSFNHFSISTANTLFKTTVSTTITPHTPISYFPILFHTFDLSIFSRYAPRVPG
jgi:hypothetical protein